MGKWGWRQNKSSNSGSGRGGHGKCFGAWCLLARGSKARDELCCLAPPQLRAQRSEEGAHGGHQGFLSPSWKELHPASV